MRPFTLRAVSVSPYYGNGFDSLTLSGDGEYEVRVNLGTGYFTRRGDVERIPTTLQFELLSVEKLCSRIGKTVVDVHCYNTPETCPVIDAATSPWVCLKSVRIIFADESVDIFWRASGPQCKEAFASSSAEFEDEDDA